MSDEIRPLTVAVVGVGAVGTSLAGELAAAGHDVLACSARRPVGDVVVLEHDGGSSTSPVRWCTSPQEVDRTADWVVVATKIPQTASVGPWTSVLSGPATRVLAAQDGVDHAARFAPLTDRPVVPALVYFQAERLGTGWARFRYTDRDLVLPDDPDGRDAAGLFAGTRFSVELVPDFVTATWTKFLRNAVVNPITALTDRRADVFTDPAIRTLARRVPTETAAVAAAEGAHLPPDAVEVALAWVGTLHPDAMTSMLQDRRAGREPEIAGLLGAGVRLAARHGLAVPATESMSALLTAALHRSPADCPTAVGRVLPPMPVVQPA